MRKVLCRFSVGGLGTQLSFSAASLRRYPLTLFLKRSKTPAGLVAEVCGTAGVGGIHVRAG